MDKKLQIYKEKLEKKQNKKKSKKEEINILKGEINVLKEEIEKIKSKIEKIDLIINPPWWTNLDGKFSIFQGLIEDIDGNEVHNDDNDDDDFDDDFDDYIPRFSENTTIEFKNESSLVFFLEDKYGDGSQISAYINYSKNCKEIYNRLTRVLTELKIKVCKKNILLLLDLLETSAKSEYIFEEIFKDLYKIIKKS